ncbi:UNVERIFIED_CONTAM: hypothetical protein FKN15_000088 [Acipenser sinensis]
MEEGGVDAKTAALQMPGSMSWYEQQKDSVKLVRLRQLLSEAQQTYFASMKQKTMMDLVMVQKSDCVSCSKWKREESTPRQQRYRCQDPCLAL